MPALPVNNTARLVVDYTWRGQAYTTLYRWIDTVSMEEAVANIDDFHAAVVNAFAGSWAVTGSGVWYPKAVNIGQDVSFTPVPAGGGGGDVTTQPDSYQQQVLGRSADGRRVSWFFQGLFLAETQNQRVQRSANANVETLIETIEDMVAIGLTTIGEAIPTVKPYVNQVYNDYLTRRARQSG